MDTSLPSPTWNRVRQRWILYAQIAKNQWPDIAFDDLLATGGSRRDLCRLVAGTYGLDDAAARRAVTLWKRSLVEEDTAPPGYTAA